MAWCHISLKIPKLSTLDCPTDDIRTVSVRQAINDTAADPISGVGGRRKHVLCGVSADSMLRNIPTET